MKQFLCLSIFSILLTIPAIGQTGGYAGEFTRLGFSPRGMAMGNAMTAVDQVGSYGYYNPALAASPGETVQLDISSAAMRFDRQLHMVSAHFRLPPTAGFSISLINSKVNDIDGRNQSGFHTETLSTAEYQLIGNFGIRFTDQAWAGIGLKYNLANYHADIPNSQNIGIDAGIRYGLTPFLTLAAAVKDLLSENDIDSAELYGTETSTDRSQQYPTRFLFGVAFEYSDHLLLSLDFEHRTQKGSRILTVSEVINGFERVRINREDITGRSQFIRLGTSYDLHDRFTLRGGMQISDVGAENLFLPSGGFSLHLPFDRFTPSVDYAFIPEPGKFSTMHVFALRLNL
jgi:hypothetical protein